MANVQVVAKCDCFLAGFRAKGEKFPFALADGEQLPPYLAEVEADQVVEPYPEVPADGAHFTLAPFEPAANPTPAVPGE